MALSKKLGNHCVLLSPVDHFTLFSLANSLPKEWRKVLKTNKTPDSFNQEFVDITRFSLFLNGKQLDIEKLYARSLYDHFVSKIATTPTGMKNTTKSTIQRTISSTGTKFTRFPSK